ncbi:DUF6783 domain-containing protein [Robinsoniella sp.]|uniref:DUF6783 domain-containing protein n=1 Tax=Robinsoniella sp. TaxID=2496533 RepID=UPI0037513E2D
MFENSFPSSARPTLRYICPNSGYVARLSPFIRDKSPTKCDAQLPESNLKTRSIIPLDIAVRYGCCYVSLI